MIRRFALLALLITACGAPPPTEAPPPDAGPMLPADAWPTAVLLRQRVSATWTGGTRGFDVALQRRGDALLLIGLAPFGPPGFVIRHGPGGVEVENNTGEALPFDPRYMLADVQKAFYPWLPPPPAGEGVVRGEVLGLVVEARYTDGRLAERRFAGPGRAIRVRYGAESIDGYAREVELTHERLGYTLRIETVAVQPLDAP